MRIPLPIAVSLSLVACMATWWLGTRHQDFLNPPSAVATAPATTQPAPPPPPPAAAPASPPTEIALDTFADQAAMGPAHLIQLARNLQEARWPHLAWLAWERLLDSTTPAPAEATLAIQSIRTLREDPRSNTDLVYPHPPPAIVIRAGTARKQVATLQPVLDRAALDVESAARGILRISTHITGGSDPADPSGHTPVAIWITGPDAASRSSEVLSFTLSQDTDLNQRVDATVSQLIRGLIARSLAKPPAADDAMRFPDEMRDCVTRRAWLALGHFLNLPVEENP